MNTAAVDLNMILTSASFVINAILLCLGVIIVVGSILIIDNLIHRYWKPIKLVWYVVPPESMPREVKEKKNDLDNSTRT